MGPSLGSCNLFATKAGKSMVACDIGLTGLLAYPLSPVKYDLIGGNGGMLPS